MNPLTTALADLAAHRELTAEAAEAAVAHIIDGHAAEPAIAGFLTALTVRGETACALAGAARAVRGRMTGLDVPGHLRPLLDTCGTGGDGAGTLNVSTAAAIVVAARGVRVAKHGNRSATGNSGSAEVLAELGVAVEAEPPALLACLEEVGIAFLFAPRFHPALRHLAPVRKQLPFRTLFNLVGPLVNPARPEYQLIGAPSVPLVDLIATALGDLAGPDQTAAVVCGDGRLDEVAPWAATEVRRVVGRRGGVERSVWLPEAFGPGGGPVDPEELRVSGPAESAARIRAILAGQRGAARDLVLANAAAALHVAGRAATLAEGVSQAAEAVDSGAAARLLKRWAAIVPAASPSGR